MKTEVYIPKVAYNSTGETKQKYIHQLSAELYGVHFIGNKKLEGKFILSRVWKEALCKREKMLGRLRREKVLQMMQSNRGRDKKLEIRAECMKGSEWLRNPGGECWEIKLLSCDEWLGKPNKEFITNAKVNRKPL